ncbi:hypothetical protein AVDCRST_MAG92-1098, partial [uncultured Coleofasciculus sp.]
ETFFVIITNYCPNGIIDKLCRFGTPVRISVRSR